MAREGHGRKDLNCFKVRFETSSEGALWPNREQPEINLAIWILNTDQVVDNSFFCTIFVLD